MTREELKNVDLDSCGLLFGLNGGVYDACKDYMNQIDYDRVKNDNALSCIAPAIRRILCMILETKSQNISIKNNQIIKVDVMGKLSVNDIIDGLDTIYSELIPIAKKYLNVVDVEAELVYLFCDNYVRLLVKNVEES